jgi:hypothetical protein
MPATEGLVVEDAGRLCGPTQHAKGYAAAAGSVGDRRLSGNE